MTAPDQRLNEIQARLAEVAQLQNSRAEHSDLDAAVYRSQSDVAFLLAELRKAHEALERVSDWAGRNRTGFYDEAQDDVVQIIRAAVAAAKGDERG